MPEESNDSSEEYCEETDTHPPLVDLLEQLTQLKKQFAISKTKTPQSIPTEEPSQLIGYSISPSCSYQAPQSSEEPVHKKIQVYMNILHTTQRESNLITTMLQDIPTFDGQDYSKLEDWFMDIETAADILTESHTCLAEAKSCGLNDTLIHKATQTGKCWDEIKSILRLKLCNANIHTYNSTFMVIQQKDDKTLATYIHCIRTAAN